MMSVLLTNTSIIQHISVNHSKKKTLNRIELSKKLKISCEYDVAFFFLHYDFKCRKHNKYPSSNNTNGHYDE